MIKERVCVGLKNGLEARPAALFVQIASKFESHIAVVVDEKNVNAKSIMGMMSLGTIKGAEIELVVDGFDDDGKKVIMAPMPKIEKISKGQDISTVNISDVTIHKTVSSDSFLGFYAVHSVAKMAYECNYYGNHKENLKKKNTDILNLILSTDDS